ncbi:MAG: alpha/beta hydrolase [Proteobacteria bacterium]|nr:alpha/beta hydrolase [Pseudomonadota bacterium]
MPVAVINGIDLYYETLGSGEPLVFIPGLGGTTDLWFQQRKYFSEYYQFISLDNRGAGRSDKPQGPYTMQQFADDLNALLDHLEITAPINLVGASMGGIIAQMFIHDHPQRVKKLALVCSGVSAGDPHYTPTSQYVMQKILNPGNTVEEKVNSFLEIFYHPEYAANTPGIRDFYLNRKIDPQPPHAYQAQLGACFDQRRYYEWLADIHVPVLVYHGREDAVWPLQNAQTLKDGLGDFATLMIMEKAGHVLMQEKPEEFNQTLHDFLKQ